MSSDSTTSRPHRPSEEWLAEQSRKDDAYRAQRTAWVAQYTARLIAAGSHIMDPAEEHGMAERPPRKAMTL